MSYTEHVHTLQSITEFHRWNSAIVYGWGRCVLDIVRCGWRTHMFNFIGLQVCISISVVYCSVFECSCAGPLFFVLFFVFCFLFLFFSWYNECTLHFFNICFCIVRKTLIVDPISLYFLVVYMYIYLLHWQANGWGVYAYGRMNRLCNAIHTASS